MKQFMRIVLTTAFVLGFFTDAFSQCQDFNEKACDDRLAPYTNYGNYISTELQGGEYAELNMTFYANQEYRLAICGLEEAEKLEFRVYDIDRNLLFKNKDHDYVRYWTFRTEASQQLTIAVVLPEKSEEQGCVAILKGMRQEQ